MSLEDSLRTSHHFEEPNVLNDSSETLKTSSSSSVLKPADEKVHTLANSNFSSTNSLDSLSTTNDFLEDDYPSISSSDMDIESSIRSSLSSRVSTDDPYLTVSSSNMGSSARNSLDSLDSLEEITPISLKEKVDFLYNVEDLSSPLKNSLQFYNDVYQPRIDDQIKEVDNQLLLLSNQADRLENKPKKTTEEKKDLRNVKKQISVLEKSKNELKESKIQAESLIDKLIDKHTISSKKTVTQKIKSAVFSVFRILFQSKLDSHLSKGDSTNTPLIKGFSTEDQTLNVLNQIVKNQDEVKKQVRSSFTILEEIKKPIMEADKEELKRLKDLAIKRFDNFLIETFENLDLNSYYTDSIKSETSKKLEHPLDEPTTQFKRDVNRDAVVSFNKQTTSPHNTDEVFALIKTAALSFPPEIAEVAISVFQAVTTQAMIAETASLRTQFIKDTINSTNSDNDIILKKWAGDIERDVKLQYYGKKATIDITSTEKPYSAVITTNTNVVFMEHPPKDIPIEDFPVGVYQQKFKVTFEEDGSFVISDAANGFLVV